MDEVNDMGTWPGPEISPVALVKVDLSYLGLEAGQIQSTSDIRTWAGGSYDQRVLITYESDAKILVSVWALRYKDKRIASSDFSSLQGWAEGNCRLSSYVNLGNKGVIRCQFTDGTNKIFLNDYWILDILAMEGGKFTPDILVDHVRDAIAAHWRTFNIPSL